MRHLHLTRRGAAAALLAPALAAAAAGCSSDRLLQADDPDLVNPSDVRSAEAADALRIGALGRFSTALTNNDASGEGYLLQSGLLADEWKSSNTFEETQQIDGRAIRRLGTVTDNDAIEESYRNLNRARVAPIQAIAALREFRPTRTAEIAQMYVLRGYAELYMAEGYCNGVTFGDASGGDVVLGEQLTTAQALETALATLDTALAVAGSATDALSATVRGNAQVGRARALLGLDRAAQAGQAVASVATSFAGITLTFLQTSGNNGVWSLNIDQRRYAVGDPTDLGLQGSPAQIATLGTHRNSLPFASARDPRVPVTTTTTAAFNTSYPTVAQQLWPSRESAIVVVSGVDARLVEAEVALARGQSAAYLPILNALRQTVTGLTPLADPGTPAARVDQFFREKAFWQFGRGYRLGDLRRLVRQYGRDQATVYPSGRFFLTGGEYGTDVVLPLPQAEQNARADFRGCFDFNA